MSNSRRRKALHLSARFLTVTAMGEQRQLLVGFRSPQRQSGSGASPTKQAPRKAVGLPAPVASRQLGTGAHALTGAPAKNAPRKRSARSCCCPPRRRSRPFTGRRGKGAPRLQARTSLFQYELEVNGLEPTIIPGHIGSPAMQTTDPVDVLNSVTVEGWKLVSASSSTPRCATGRRLLPLQALAEAAPDDEQPLAGPQRRQLSKPFIRAQAWSLGRCQRCGAISSSIASGPQEPGS